MVFVSHHLFFSYFNRRRQIKDGNFKITFDEIVRYHIDSSASTGSRGHQGKVYLKWHCIISLPVGLSTSMRRERLLLRQKYNIVKWFNGC